MNYFHLKLYNRFIFERANKLQCIYINQRAFKRLNARVLSEKELLRVIYFEDNGDKAILKVLAEGAK